MKRALLAALLLAGCEGVEGGAHWDLERMLVQPRYEAYRASRFFADSSAMRTPPRGTLPHGASIGPTLLVDGTEDGRDATRIPVPLTMPLLEVGRQRFEITCASCHGLRGDGCSVVASRMQLRQPPSLLEPRVRAFTPGRVYRVIREGYGLMPAYETLLSVEERWAVVAYLRALQLSQDVALDSLPPAIRERALHALAERQDAERAERPEGGEGPVPGCPLPGVGGGSGAPGVVRAAASGAERRDE